MAYLSKILVNYESFFHNMHGGFFLKYVLDRNENKLWHIGKWDILDISELKTEHRKDLK